MSKETREYKVLSTTREHGRSSADIECPFCGAVVTAYLWSLAGSGKKCPCGAKHTHFQTILYTKEQSND